jgi:hypothetical protein
MSNNDRQQRAEERRRRAVLQRVQLGGIEPDLDPIQGIEAISLATRLTRESWSISGRPWPRYARADTPYRFVPGRPE